MRRSHGRVVHRHTAHDDDVSRCKQEFGEAADIRNIANRYLRTGMAPQVNREAMYADFTNVDDYLSCLNLIKEAERNYDLLPIEVKDRFQGLGELVVWLEDDGNLEQAVGLGLIELEEAVRRGYAPPDPAEREPAVAGGSPATEEQSDDTITPS